MNLRTIVVDDSTVFRKVLRDCLAELPGVEVIDIAKDGVSAIEKICRCRPDLVTLDVEMPCMDGLQVLNQLQKESFSTNVIMVSSQTQRGAVTTTKALQNGAFDFILKPRDGDLEKNVSQLTGQLRSRVETLQSRSFLASNASDSAVAFEQRSRIVLGKRSNRTRGFSAVCIAVSTGGPKALSHLLPRLSRSTRVPIFIVQHMPALFTASMARSLNDNTPLPVHEAEDGMPIAKGHVYIAPGGKQMRVGGFPGARRIEITNDQAVNCCKPSADYLFQSCASQFRDKLLAIVMTGMGDDGLVGCHAVAKQKGQIWAQDKATSTVFGMPRSVIDANLAECVFPIDEIAKEINRLSRHASAESQSFSTNEAHSVAENSSLG